MSSGPTLLWTHTKTESTLFKAVTPSLTGKKQMKWRKGSREPRLKTTSQ